MPLPTYELQAHATDPRARHYRDVQRRAYDLWEQAGRPEGMRTADESWQDHFWKTAERDVTGAETWSAVVDCASSLC
jgi:hypothetical protein